MLEAPELTDLTPDGMYGILSLPAFYCQYMLQNPERIPGRAAYIAGLYRRALGYAGSFTTSDDLTEIFHIIKKTRLLVQDDPTQRLAGCALRWTFPYYAMEYYCGLYGLDQLLSRIEGLLEAPELTDLTPQGSSGAPD